MPMKRAVTHDSASQLPLDLPYAPPARRLTEFQGGPPPFHGWWNCRIKGAPRNSYSMRRWWNGECWSWPATPGVDDEEYAETMKHRESDLPVDGVEWQGLTTAAVYGYKLVETQK